MPYAATNDWGALDATKPAGTDSPDVIDDALRETRLTAKTVMQNGHTSKGAHQVATWKHSITVDTAGAIVADVNKWIRRPMNVISDPFSLLVAGVWTNTIKPIAGVYLIRFWAFGYKMDRFQARVAVATGNTLLPSAANFINELVGSVVFAENASNGSGLSVGSAYWVTDGTVSLCLDQMQATGGAAGTNFIGFGPFGGGAAAPAAFPAGVEFIRLAATL